MKNTFGKISSLIQVKSNAEFFTLLKKIDSTFYEQTFHKSKNNYLQDIRNLLSQLEEDFHYVYILKRKSHVFQLQWKESVLAAHLNLITLQLPEKYLTTKPVYQLRVV